MRLTPGSLTSWRAIFSMVRREIPVARATDGQAPLES